MTFDAKTAKRVRHPILRLDVVEADGSRAPSHRVYCKLRSESVPLGVCCACARCEGVVEAPVPTLECTLPADEGDECAARVGHLLAGGTAALTPDVTAADAFRILFALTRLELPVVDAATHEVLGVVREWELSRSRRRWQTVRAITVGETMSSPIVVHESTSVHDALVMLASAHLREATVVTQHGVAVGVFRDVDGLRAMARTAQPGFPSTRGRTRIGP